MNKNYKTYEDFLKNSGEKDWQNFWEKNKINFCDLSKAKNKFYNLVMFFYPSGDKIHIGHGYNYTGADVFGRYKKMKGFNVLQPMGYDAFGLPAENYAIKTGVHPAVSTKENTEFGKKQLQELGLMFDWSKEIDTSSPKYYKWTQWIFSVLYKAGLAYRKEAPVNWCPSCKTVLANEQVISGKCERCDSEVIQKNLKQWFFKITDYAEKLLEGHNKIDWPQKTIAMQKNWIGKSFGTEVDFEIEGQDKKISVFTTRVDTIFSGTFLILAPENPLVEKITTDKQKKEVEKYLKKTLSKSDLERTELNKEKSGVFTGAYAINPANNDKMPIWISDFVLASYGTGAVFADAHDERDFEMAKEFNLPLKVSIKPANGKNWDKIKKLKECFTEDGVLVNSEQFDGLTSEEARIKITEWFEKRGVGRKKINYKLRDWLISRQRYWGAPIPIIFCEQCGEVLDEKLPVKLPELDNFKPTAEGESPLARSKEFVNVKCPKCGADAKRCTETMDTFVCSSWYFLRYLNPDLEDKAFDKKLADKWLPVDQYCGGAEHAVMHLMYARFITKVLFDQKLINFDEPFLKLNHQGMILAEDGGKMSKSKGNVVIPDDYVKKYGADVFRTYVLFLAPFEQGGAWSDQGILGVKRFLDKVWNLQNKLKIQNSKVKIASQNSKLERLVHQTIKKVSEDIESFHFNTAVSQMMILVNEMEKSNQLSIINYQFLILLLSPFAPHLCEEIWNKLEHKNSIFNEPWPEYDEKLIVEDKITLAVQINGKVRDEIIVPADMAEEKVKEKVLASEKVQKWLDEKEPKKIIYVKGKLVSIVI